MTNFTNRRSFLKALGLGTVSLGLSGCLNQTSQKRLKDNRPNIIFIMSDDHAAQAISCYGSKRNKTPNIDRIASEGMRLTNCFCTNSICTPSRASILTDKWQGHPEPRKKIPKVFLTNLANDRPELKNHAKEQPQIVKHLMKLHEQWQKDVMPAGSGEKQ